MNNAARVSVRVSRVRVRVRVSRVRVRVRAAIDRYAM